MSKRKLLLASPNMISYKSINEAFTQGVVVDEIKSRFEKLFLKCDDFTKDYIISFGLFRIIAQSFSDNPILMAEIGVSLNKIILDYKNVNEIDIINTSFDLSGVYNNNVLSILKDLIDDHESIYEFAYSIEARNIDIIKTIIDLIPDEISRVARVLMLFQSIVAMTLKNNYNFDIYQFFNGIEIDISKLN